MTAQVYWFEPEPTAAELPQRFPSPFVPGQPHPVAGRAAQALVSRLQRGDVPGESALHAPGAGKMFGVLVIADPAGRVGYLCGFSGMLDGRWQVDGFVPPLFDVVAREAVWPDGEASLRDLDRELATVVDDDRARDARATLTELTARHDHERSAMVAAHLLRRQLRRAARNELTSAGLEFDHARAHDLDQESRADAAERRRLDSIHRTAMGEPKRRVAGIEAEVAVLQARRIARSRELWDQLLATYVVISARGQLRTLVELFAPIPPPGGAGDCAAPKLLGHALRCGLRPLALAEWWWGAPPISGGRHHGAFYPACRGKCGPILPHQLDGLDPDAPPLFGAQPVADHEPMTVFEDNWLLVVAKPCGLLSVPGRSGLLRDSVQTRLRLRFPQASGPLVVHRLDLDTSGLLLAAKDLTTHGALQRQFLHRQLHKRYVAWLAGEVIGECGTIELALRPDLDDRPRQIHDPVHGKPALTTWQVVARSPGRTRVAMTPHTGRTHQLRLHAAHALGLAAPIVGDRLYGTDADREPRLLLHAESLTFVHPHTGQTISLTVPTPF